MTVAPVYRFCLVACCEAAGEPESGVVVKRNGVIMAVCPEHLQDSDLVIMRSREEEDARKQEV